MGSGEGELSNYSFYSNANARIPKSLIGPLSSELYCSIPSPVLFLRFLVCQMPPMERGLFSLPSLELSLWSTFLWFSSASTVANPIV